ncbi:MAG: hypothetical protein ACRD2A_04780, partial [Vicinamibacterales bacterium]
FLTHPDLGRQRLAQKIGAWFSTEPPRRRRKAPAGHARHLVGRWAESMEQFRGEPTPEALARWERIRAASVRPTRRQLMREPPPANDVAARSE